MTSERERSGLGVSVHEDSHSINIVSLHTLHVLQAAVCPFANSRHASMQPHFTDEAQEGK